MQGMRVDSQRTFFDREIETLDRGSLLEFQDQRFRMLLKQVLETNPFYRRKLSSAGIQKPLPLSRIAELPFTTKAEIVNDHAEHPPFGSNLTFPVERYTRVHQTSGTTGRPVRWLDTPESWESYVKQWGFVLRSAGVQPGDRVYLAFSFGPFFGFWGAFEAAHRYGALAITGGGQSSEQRLAGIQDLHPTVLISTPTYALRLAEIARNLHIDTAKLRIRITIHAGEPGAGIPATRRRIEELWAAKAYDHIGMTEMGAYGYECHAQLGPHVNESEFILEVIDPQTTQPVNEGRGEVVLTNLGRLGSPLIRYRTGDLAEVTRSRCVCGRTFAALLGGVLGRADDMIVIRGINVFPSAIEDIIRGFPEVVEFQGEVVKENHMNELLLRLEIDLQQDQQQALAERLMSQMRVRLNLRPVLQFAPQGSLPRSDMKSRRFRFVTNQ